MPLFVTQYIPTDIVFRQLTQNIMMFLVENVVFKKHYISDIIYKEVLIKYL